MVDISVIIPAHNTAGYIEKCIKSVLVKDDLDKEIIVIDDNSSDETVSIIHRISKNDERVKVVCLEKSKGVSNARNIGLEMAKGKYIAFIDSDDYVCKSYFRRLYDCAEAHNANITMCGYMIETDGRLIHNNESKREGAEGNDFYSDWLIYFFCVNGVKHFSPKVWRSLFRRKFIEENRIRFTNCKVEEDTLFTTECIIKNPPSISIPYINEELYIYLIRKKSSSHGSRNDLHDKVVCFKQLENIISDSTLTNVQKNSILQYTKAFHRNALLINALRENSYTGMRKYVKTVRKSEFGEVHMNMKEKFRFFFCLNRKKRIYECFFSIGLFTLAKFLSDFFVKNNGGD